MGRCFSVWVGIHLTNNWTAKAKAVIEHTIHLTLEYTDLKIHLDIQTGRIPKQPRSKRFQNINRISDDLQSESSIFQQIIVFKVSTGVLFTQYFPLNKPNPEIQAHPRENQQRIEYVLPERETH